MSLRFLLILLIIVCSCQIQAKKYVSLSPHLTEILFDLGVGEQLVGTVEHSDYPAAAKDLAIIGNFHQLNIEAIVAYQPDIIFAWPDGNPQLQLDRLADLGLQIFESRPQNLQQLIDEIITIGNLVGKTQRATQLTDAMRYEARQISERFQAKQPMRVFYQIWHQPLRALGSDPWLNDLLSRCGAVNLFAHLPQAFPLVSIEAVLEKQPDIILLPEANQHAANVELWQKWPALSAVKNNNIATINADWLHRYTRRSIQGLSSLCESIDTIRNKS